MGERELVLLLFHVVVLDLLWPKNKVWTASNFAGRGNYVGVAKELGF